MTTRPSADPLLFAPEATRPLAERVAACAGLSLAPLEEREFEDGEHKARPLVPVRGRDVYVIQSLHGDGSQSVNDKLCRLLFLCGALGEASAASVTAVVPYLAYARKDRQTKPRDPVTTRYVAALVEAVGVGRVVALDVHNLQAFQNAFRCRTDHLEALPVLVHHVAGRLGGEPATVIAPDAGGVARANAFRAALGAITGEAVGSAIAEKRRSGGVVTGDLLVGGLDGRAAVIVYDLISTGGTMARTARRAMAMGATRVLAVATHGVFAAAADAELADPAVTGLVVTDSVAPGRLGGPAAAKLDVVPVAPLLGEALVRIQRGGSIVDLLDPLSPAWGADQGGSARP